MTEEAIYVLEKMTHGFNRMGREAGRGFYDYHDDGTSELWSGLRVFERRKAAIPDEDIRDRLLYRMVAESMRCLAEGVIESAAAADLSSVRDAGFPAALGGTISFAGISADGIPAINDRANELADRYGERFRLPVLANHR